MSAVLTNLIENPSAEVNATGAGSSNTTSLARDTAQAYLGGIASFKAVWNGGGAGEFYFNAYAGTRIVAVAGTSYTFRIRVYDASAARNWRPRIEWYTAGPTFHSAVDGSYTVSTLNAWTTEYVITATAPGSVVFVTPMMVMQSAPTNGHITYFDCAILAVTNSLVTGYFDGTYADLAYSYSLQSWAGTPHASKSSILAYSTAPSIFTAVLASDGRGFNLAVTAADFTNFTITRQVAGASGTVIVRGTNSAALDGLGVANVKDIEVPQNTQVTYQLTVSRAAPAYSAVTSWVSPGKFVAFGGPVIYDLSSSAAPTVVRVNSWEDLDHDIPTEMVWPDNAEAPIAVSGAMHLPSSKVTLLTITNAEYLAIRNIIKGGITCFAPEFPDRYGDPDGLVYLSVIRMSEKRLTMKRDNPARYLTLEVQEIAPPPASFVPVTARTWDSAYGLGYTWDALSSLYTWDQLAGYSA